jgi:hypothetical protein
MIEIQSLAVSAAVTARRQSRIGPSIELRRQENVSPAVAVRSVLLVCLPQFGRDERQILTAGG